MQRRQWFDWHSWAGFQLSILMTFVLVTGTFATVSFELDWLANDAVRAKHGQPAQLDWGGVLDSASKHYPDATLAWANAPIAPWFNAEVVATRADDSLFRIYVDPMTLEVSGEGRWYNWQRFFRMTHRHLMLPIPIGVTIVGLLSLPLLVSLLSSFFIYKKWWRGFFRWPAHRTYANAKPVRKARTLWAALHRLAGVWSLWFIFLIAATGLWYLLEQWGARAQYPPVPIPVVALEDAPRLSGAAINQMHTRAIEAYPDLQITQVSLRDWNKGAVLFQGQSDALLVRPRANHVLVGMSPEEIDVRRASTLGWYVRIAEAMDPLHFGTFGGAVTRFLWFFFGALMSLLSITGVYLFGLRVARSNKRYFSSGTEVAALSWHGLRPWARWVPVVLLLLMSVLVTIIFLIDPGLLI